MSEFLRLLAVVVAEFILNFVMHAMPGRNIPLGQPEEASQDKYEAGASPWRLDRFATVKDGATAKQRLYALLELLAVFPEEWETKQALRCALYDSDPIVAWSSTQHSERGHLLTWRRLALLGGAPASIRLLCLHRLQGSMSGADWRKLLLGACVGPISGEKGLSSTQWSAMRELVNFWCHALEDEALELRKMSVLQKDAERLLGWFKRGETVTKRQFRVKEFERLLESAMFREETFFRRVLWDWRDKEVVWEESEYVLRAPMFQLLEVASIEHGLTTLRILRSLAHPAVEPLLLSCLQQYIHDDLLLAVIRALATCGTHAAVKPLMSKQKRLSSTLQQGCEEAIRQIQARAATMAVGGLSLADEVERSGALSLDEEDEFGHLSLDATHMKES